MRLEIVDALSPCRGRISSERVAGWTRDRTGRAGELSAVQSCERWQQLGDGLLTVHDIDARCEKEDGQRAYPPALQNGHYRKPEIWRAALKLDQRSLTMAVASFFL